MSGLYEFFKPLVFKFEPELAHKLAVKVIKCGCLPDFRPHAYEIPYLIRSIFGMYFESPIGLAAGFDKNAETLENIHKLGFGFAECGTLTPNPQAGNPKPRLFRLVETEALINRLGFNNDGLKKALERLKNSSNSPSKMNRRFQIPVGINIGPNKNSEDFSSDYVQMIEQIYESAIYFNYIAINVSSPNTPGLRDLQKTKELDKLLAKICRANIEYAKIFNRPSLPLFLKLSPDTGVEALNDTVDLAIEHKLAALIISNTTVSRTQELGELLKEQGGLSGKPLFDLSTKMLARAYVKSNGRIKLIGVGGISSPEEALVKIEAGADLLQIYTGLVYKGLGLIKSINSGLVKLMIERGINSIEKIVGTRAQEFI